MPGTTVIQGATAPMAETCSSHLCHAPLPSCSPPAPTPRVLDKYPRRNQGCCCTDVIDCSAVIYLPATATWS
jgi:hypothetical protein